MNDVDTKPTSMQFHKTIDQTDKTVELEIQFDEHGNPTFVFVDIDIINELMGLGGWSRVH